MAEVETLAKSAKAVAHAEKLTAPKARTSWSVIYIAFSMSKTMCKGMRA